MKLFLAFCLGVFVVTSAVAAPKRCEMCAEQNLGSTVYPGPQWRGLGANAGEARDSYICSRNHEVRTHRHKDGRVEKTKRKLPPQRRLE